MSRGAIKYYLTQQLQGLDVPVPLTVLRQSPKTQPVGEQAVLVIAMPDRVEKRYTTPRGKGRKHVESHVNLNVYWLAQDEQQGGDWFEVLLGKIEHILRSAPYPASITDPLTGEQTELLIGEDITTHGRQPVLDQGQNLVIFFAQVTVMASEYLTESATN